MRTKLMALVLVALSAAMLSASGLSAQSLAVRSHLGTFAPLMPLVAIGDGYNNDIELGAAPAYGLALDVGLTPAVSIYGGIQATFTRLNHSGVMELRDLDGHSSSRVNLLMPTGGFIYSPEIGKSAIRPTIRLGAGVKLYDFDLYDVKKLTSNLVGDAGLGFSAGSGPIALTTEARWLPSRFDARTLPLRVIGNTMQNQNDWLFSVGFSVKLGGQDRPATIARTGEAS
jgi:hypothetical protein